MTIFYDTQESPVGLLLLTAEEGGLTSIYMGASPEQIDAGWREGSALLREARAQLAEYFAGKRRRFDIALAPGGTPFQQRVWGELCQIEYGATTSYGEIAKRLGDANASRAVGLANGRNPIPILIPCHRVIGRDGALTGYAGGIARKKFLLELEGVLLRV